MPRKARAATAAGPAVRPEDARLPLGPTLPTDSSMC